jgi:hypothetical protein
MFGGGGLESGCIVYSSYTIECPEGRFSHARFEIVNGNVVQRPPCLRRAKEGETGNGGQAKLDVWRG